MKLEKVTYVCDTCGDSPVLFGKDIYRGFYIYHNSPNDKEHICNKCYIKELKKVIAQLEEWSDK